MNRASAERLVQAETVWALCNSKRFPAESFQETWRNILLYSEHTWGAHNSISQPDLPFVRDQWKLKQEFAVRADEQSRELLKRARAGDMSPCPDSQAPAGHSQVTGTDLSDSTEALDPFAALAIDVLNTSSWTRTDL